MDLLQSCRHTKLDRDGFADKEKGANMKGEDRDGRGSVCVDTWRSRSFRSGSSLLYHKEKKREGKETSRKNEVLQYQFCRFIALTLQCCSTFLKVTYVHTYHT